MADIIQIRRDTAANWTAANPILAQGEFGVETDTLKLKIGDGASPWTGLRYYHSGSPYDAGEGISINDFTINNTGIITVGTGSTNGTIKANGQDIAVKGLGSAAFVDTTTLPNKDLSNLSSTGKNIANWSSNVTNCITEIPQNINLTLSNGTLTLKAGSKVTYPDGTQITISTDETIPTHSTDGEYVCVRNKTGGAGSFLKSLCYSGTTAPTGFSGNALWFDTTNNIIKNSYDSGATWSNDWSFPVGMVTSASSAYTSIDQVFNGFGFIGSIVFALPGVKGLYPNGRNTDGTLKSGAINIGVVQTYTVGSTFIKAIRITSSGLFGYRGYIVSDTKPSVNFNMWYNPSENTMYDTGGGTPSKLNASIAATIIYDGTRITSFNPKTAFHAVDYNDGNFIAHQAMPSSRYVDLTLPSSSGTITAPADGYLTVIKGATSSGLAFTFTNTNNSLVSGVQSAGAINCRCFIPASKGDVVRVDYSLNGTTSMFRFVYANGAK